MQPVSCNAVAKARAAHAPFRVNPLARRHPRNSAPSFDESAIALIVDSDETALVTGASNTIGRAIVTAFEARRICCRQRP
jgi:hypothetical protein